MPHLLPRLLRSQPVAMFCCLGSNALYLTLEEPPGIASLVAPLTLLPPTTSIALWLQRDAQRCGVSLPHDLGLFAVIAWPVAGPTCLFSTSGWRGVLPLGWFVLLHLGALALGFLVGLLPAHA